MDGRVKRSWRGPLVWLLVGVLAVVASGLRAGEPAPAAAEAKPAAVAKAEKTAGAVWKEVARKVVAALAWAGKNAFPVTLGLILILGIVSAIMARRLSDRCLKDIQKGSVVVELKDGTRQRGQINLQSTGFELVYDRGEDAGESDLSQEAAAEASGPEAPRSFVFYQSEYAKLQALVRYLDALAEEERKKRDRRNKGVFQPGLFRRTRRRVRNLLASLKDSVLEVLTALIGRFKTGGAGADVFKTQEKYISRLGTDMVNVATAYSYDPMLENLIGRRVLVEVGTAEGGPARLAGVFKEYSKDFMSFIDVVYPGTRELTLATGAQRTALSGVPSLGGVELLRDEGGRPVVRNGAAFAVEVKTVRAEMTAVGPWKDRDEIDEVAENEMLAEQEGNGQESAEPAVRELAPGRVLEPGAEMGLDVGQGTVGAVTVWLVLRRRADVIMPRATSVVRHRV